MGYFINPLELSLPGVTALEKDLKEDEKIAMRFQYFLLGQLK